MTARGRGGAGSGPAAALFALFATAAPIAAAQAADPLPEFAVDLAQSSVSGLSSGAYMAGQFHVAFFGLLVGVGIVAGGPYNCAEGQLPIALNRCMQTTLGASDPERLHAKAEALAAEGRIDPLSGLQGDRVYIFSGSEQTRLRWRRFQFRPRPLSRCAGRSRDAAHPPPRRRGGPGHPADPGARRAGSGRRLLRD